MTDKEYIEAMTKIMKYLMSYDDSMKLTKYMYLRIKALPQGKFIANNHIKSNANYSYNTIINTFRYFKPEIDKALSSVIVKDDQHRFNLILSIIDKHLNDTVILMRKKEEMVKKQENTNVDSLVHKQASYKTKAENNIDDNNSNNKLKSEMKELW